ncbi:DUF2061 domain-containing protein [Reinekea blandensis]|uniref:Predicted membrane protein n=1 Tax=Reinekea blandensis MED297 TaxID=314283 RepID=A4BBC3_9GAMM|nr:DUF2061 domain-containing protein [Reinekea blandensis]EAR10736.1 predicted membrane protein [Reinekea sp. MED297] [Reinekea blandensis MED297]
MKTTGIKTITFAITHFSVAFLVGWAITGSFVMGSLLAIVEPAVNTVAYAIHESFWQKRQNRKPQSSTDNTDSHIRMAV